MGIGLLFGGMAATLLPQIVGFFFAHFVLRMNPILLLGALQTVTAAMAAVQERSGCVELFTGISGCEHSPDNLGHDHGPCSRRLNTLMVRPRPLPSFGSCSSTTRLAA